MASSFGASAGAETSSSTRAMPRSSAASSAAAPPCSEQVVGVGARDRRRGDHDAAALGLQPLGGALGGAHAGAALVVVGEDDDLGDVVGDLHPLEALGGERRPDRPPRREVPQREPGLDALAEDQRQAGDGLAEPDRAAGGLAEHHLRLLDPRLHRLVRVEVGAVHADDAAGPVADDADQRRMPGAGVPVGEVRVEAQIGVVEDLEAALPEVGLGLRAGDRHGVAQDELDLLGGILPAGSGRRPRRRRGGDRRWLAAWSKSAAPVRPEAYSTVLIGPPPSPVSKSCQSPAFGPRSSMTQEPFRRGASPRMLARRHWSPTRRPFGKSCGTQVAAELRSPATIASRSCRGGLGAAGATSLRSIIVAAASAARRAPSSASPSRTSGRGRSPARSPCAAAARRPRRRG